MRFALLSIVCFGTQRAGGVLVAAHYRMMPARDVKDCYREDVENVEAVSWPASRIVDDKPEFNHIHVHVASPRGGTAGRLKSTKQGPDHPASAALATV